MSPKRKTRKVRFKDFGTRPYNPDRDETLYITRKNYASPQRVYETLKQTIRWWHKASARRRKRDDQWLEGPSKVVDRTNHERGFGEISNDNS